MSFMLNYLQNLRDKRSKGKNGIFFFTYMCEILMPGQIPMRVNKEMLFGGLKILSYISFLFLTCFPFMSTLSLHHNDPPGGIS